MVVAGSLRPAACGTFSTLRRTCPARRIVVLGTLGRTCVAGRRTGCGDDLAGRSLASVDLGARIANVGAIEARLDASRKFRLAVFQAFGHAFQAGRPAVVAFPATSILFGRFRACGE